MDFKLFPPVSQHKRTEICWNVQASAIPTACIKSIMLQMKNVLFQHDCAPLNRTMPAETWSLTSSHKLPRRKHVYYLQTEADICLCVSGGCAVCVSWFEWSYQEIILINQVVWTQFVIQLAGFLYPVSFWWHPFWCQRSAQDNVDFLQTIRLTSKSQSLSVWTVDRLVGPGVQGFQGPRVLSWPDSCPVFSSSGDQDETLRWK